MGGQSTSPGVVTVTPIYWAGAGVAFTASYKSIVDGYLANVAAASGRSDNVFSVNTQYFDQLGTQSTQRISYSVTAGADINVTDPYTSASTPTCTGSKFTACVTDGRIKAELSTLAAAGTIHPDDSHLYLVMLPQGVRSCETGGGNGAPCSDNAFCGYHSAAKIGTGFAIFANLPFEDPSGCADPFNGAQSPNGNVNADIAVSIISHEANEAITDWSGAWFDRLGNENGDECIDVFGAPLGGSLTAGTAFNQVIGTGHYYTQDEFSNADYRLGRGDPATTGTATTNPAVSVPVNGCVQRLGTLTAPVITSLATQTATIGHKVSFVIKATGYVTPILKVTGTLPTGLTLTDHFNGTATISGIAKEAGAFVLQVGATNGLTATSMVTLKVNAAPKITSAAVITAVRQKQVSFVITTSGYPIASISESGTLPAGLTLVDRHDGTAIVSGTPTSKAGTFAVTVHASSSAGRVSAGLRIVVS